MPGSPKLVLDEDVLHTVLGLRAPERRQVLRLLGDIQNNWWKDDADYLITDSADRHLKVRAVQSFLVTYWHDGPVDELRIVDLRRIRSS